MIVKELKEKLFKTKQTGSAQVKILHTTKIVQSYPRLGVKIPSLHLLILKFFLLLCVQIEEEEEEEETSGMIDPIPKEDTNPPPNLIPVFVTSTQ
jgi:hypothetical protein